MQEKLQGLVRLRPFLTILVHTKDIASIPIRKPEQLSIFADDLEIKLTGSTDQPVVRIPYANILRISIVDLALHVSDFD